MEFDFISSSVVIISGSLLKIYSVELLEFAGKCGAVALVILETEMGVLVQLALWNHS